MGGRGVGRVAGTVLRRGMTNHKPQRGREGVPRVGAKGGGSVTAPGPKC